MCHMASMNMASMNPINYSPHPTQFLQSPPGQFLTTASTAPPPWASTIMEDIKSIKSDVARIENIEKLVNSMNLKLKDLETKITNVDKRLNDVETSTTFLSDKYEEQSSSIKAAKSDVNNQQDSCQSLEQTMNSLGKASERANERIIEAEFRSMR